MRVGVGDVVLRRYQLYYYFCRSAFPDLPNKVTPPIETWIVLTELAVSLSQTYVYFHHYLRNAHHPLDCMHSEETSFFAHQYISSEYDTWHIVGSPLMFIERIMKE